MIIDYNELIGKTLGTCTIRRLLGRGGMGAVYLAQQARPRRTVAVKVLLPATVMEKRPRAEFLARFRREADAIAALDHINIMPVYEYGEDEDIAYLVMPYVTGGTLKDRLEQKGILPIEEVIPIIEQAADGLDSAHAQGIVHRDLKPANILFHADGRVLLADFGLAKVLRDIKESDFRTHGTPAGLTSAGTIVGTPEYLSPEQGTGKPVDHRTDIYSLGITLFQMLGGTVPFTGTSPVAIAIKHTLEQPPSLRKLNPKVTPEMEAVVFKAIAKEPEQRYNSIGELARALKIAAENAKRPPETNLSKFVDMQTITPPPEPKPYTPDTADIDDAETRLELETTGPMATPPYPAGGQPLRISSQPAETGMGGSPYSARTVAHTPTRIPPQIAPQTPSRPLEQGQPQPGPQLYSSQKVPSAPSYKNGPVYPPPQTPPVPPATPVQPNTIQQQTSARRQPRLMVMLGVLLALLVIVGGLASYFYILNGNNKASSTPPGGAQTSLDATATATAQDKKPLKELHLPSPIVNAGERLYGTEQPGPDCDQRGGKWKTVAGLTVTCNDTDVTLHAGGNAGGLLLQSWPNQPQGLTNYVIQLQIKAISGSFGVIYTNEDTNKLYDAFVFNEAGAWVAEAHDENMQVKNSMTSSPIASGISNLHDEITIAIQVQGGNATMQIKDAYNGNAMNQVSSSYACGILVQPGSSVVVKNVAIYAY